MDYNALAQQFGGTTAQDPTVAPSATPDYSALAQQFGGKTTSAPQSPNAQQGSVLDKTENILNTFFGGKQVGSTIGTELGYAYTKIKDAIDGTNESAYYDRSTPTLGQNLGDLAQMALTVAAPGVGGETLGVGGRIAASTALGAGLGASSAAANKENIGTGAFVGGGLGLAGGTAGEILGNVLGKVLPTRLVQNVLRGADTETVQTALEKGVTSVEGGIVDSNKTITDLGTQIQKILSGEDNLTNTGAGSDSLDNALIDFQNSKLYPSVSSESDVEKATEIARTNLVEKLRSYAPNSSSLIDKLAEGSATLADKNTLRQELDQVYMTADPESNFTKQIAKNVADNLRGEVQAYAPETQPLFRELSKEIPLRNALESAQERLGKGKAMSAFSLLKMIGVAFGGLPGYLGAATAEGIIKNPTVDLSTAQTLLKGSSILGGAMNAVKAPILRNISSLISPGQENSVGPGQQ